MLGLGTKCYKDNFDSKLYTRMADFCNSTMSYQIEDKGEYYEIVERVTEEPSEKELLEREKAELEAWLKSHDYIGVKIATGRATIDDYATEIAEMTEKAERINEINAILESL